MENKELNLFYKLLEKTPLEDIKHERGASTNLITKVEIVNSSTCMTIAYTNVRTEYEIRYKGVYIKKDEVKSNSQINNAISDILAEKVRELQNEFYNIE